jgi:DNA-binding winged helix-turn-helix (wHTH) protein/tetratricopeptide (TPR) repeat protein
MTEPETPRLPDETRADYVFARFRLSPTLWKLWDESTVPPEEIPLDGKAPQVLAYLLDNHDRIVSKDELLSEIWTGQVVSENALTQVIARLRRALGDSSRQASLIQTVRNRGYRYIGDPVNAAAAAPAALSRARPRGRWPLVGVAVAAVLVTVAGVALLREQPGDAPVADAEFAAFAGADSAARSAALAGLHSVSVDVRGLDDDAVAQFYAESLGSGLSLALPGLFAVPVEPAERTVENTQPPVLTGTILTSAHELLVNLELVHKQGAAPLWRVQDLRIPTARAMHYRIHLAETLASLTRRPLHPDLRSELQFAIVQPQTPLELLVAGRARYLQFAYAANERAIEFFERALREEPEFVAARSSLALSIVARSHRFGMDDRWLEEGAQIAQEAVNQSSNAYDAWRALGMVALEGRKPNVALEYFQTALALAPRHYPTVFTVSQTLFNMGRLDEAIEIHARFPEHPYGRAMLVSYLIELGLHDEADRFSALPFPHEQEFALVNFALLYKAAVAGNIDDARELGDALRRAYPEMRASLLLLCAEIEQRAGNEDAARKMFREAYAANPEGAGARLRMAEIWLLEDRQEEAHALLDRVIQEGRQRFDIELARWPQLRELALAAALRGDVEQALTWRDRSIEAGAYTNEWDHTDSRFRAIATEPRFAEQTLLMQARMAKMRSRALDSLVAGSPRASESEGQQGPLVEGPRLQEAP